MGAGKRNAVESLVAEGNTPFVFDLIHPAGLLRWRRRVSLVQCSGRVEIREVVAQRGGKRVQGEARGVAVDLAVAAFVRTQG